MDLSVVIPSYRSESLVRRAIESVIAEGVAPGNIIVVEDGVFDQTAAVVRAIDGVRLVTLEQNGGAPHARNTGLNHVTTRYVMFLDADDYVENGLLEGMLSAISESDAGVVMGPWLYARERRDHGLMRKPPVLSNAEWVFHWLRPVFFPPCSVLWKTESVRAIGAWDERLRKNQDGELMLRAFMSDLPVAVSSKGNGVYWQHESPHRVSDAKVDDLLHSADIVFGEIETWLTSGSGRHLRSRYLAELGRFCCIVAWDAFSYQRNETARLWRERARRFGFNNRGYSAKSSLLAAFLGVRISSRIKARASRPGAFYKTLSQR